MISKWPKKKLPALKKIFNMAYNAEKNLTSLHVKILSPEIWGNKFLLKQKHPYLPPSKVKWLSPQEKIEGL